MKFFCYGVFFLSLFLISRESVDARKIIPITIMKDGVEFKKMNLFIIKKMGYLKARDVADIFKADINYNSSSKELLLNFNNRGDVRFVVGNLYIEIDGIKRKMKKKPHIIDGNFYLPLEAVITRAFESLSGAQIHWDFSDRILWISYTGNISDVRYYTYDKYTRFVIEMTGDLKYSHTNSGGILKLIIHNGRLTVPFKDINVNDTVIKRVDINEAAMGVEFSIVTGKNAGYYKVMKFPSPPRVVVDVENTRSISTDKSLDDLPPQPAGPVQRRKRYVKEIKLIVIDPGHGGKDPGAIGSRGTKEKDIVLSISKKLAKKIRRKLKIPVILTRTGDYFLPLAKRTRIANSKDACIFISIHCNASFKPKTKGFEVYFLSEEASDNEAQAVANLENSVIAMEDKDMDKVSRILWLLTMNQFMNESSELCSFINKSVLEKTDLAGRGVKQAGFYVLKGARMPAALVEIGFLSNKSEERLLNRKSFQNRVIDALCDAVSDYRKWVKSGRRNHEKKRNPRNAER